MDAHPSPRGVDIGGMGMETTREIGLALLALILGLGIGLGAFALGPGLAPPLAAWEPDGVCLVEAPALPAPSPRNPEEKAPTRHC